MSDDKYAAMYWLHKADEARVSANSMQDPEARAILMRIADSYDAIAALMDSLSDQEKKLMRSVNKPHGSWPGSGIR